MSEHVPLRALALALAGAVALLFVVMLILRPHDDCLNAGGHRGLQPRNIGYCYDENGERR